MLSSIAETSVEISGFSSPIYKDVKLSSDLKNSVQLLKNQWRNLRAIIEEQLFQCSDLLLPTLSSSTNQQKIILQLAKNAFFFKRSITWVKKCDPSDNGGHHIRVNSRAFTKKEAHEQIKRYSERLSNDPHVKDFKGWKKEIPGGNKYDVRFTIIHTDNAPECNFLPREQATDEVIYVADVLEKFDNQISKHNLSKAAEYTVLFSLITQKS